MDLESFIKSSI